ncbi:MAG: class I SAM-dependent methyltransferase [Gammaproteobacteria bacterium]|nr:class I SAM-dependent methyltransferase [Gammaproteobacteria bacterium]NVK87563.1 class I SAM-dependent methyltransferase [Gammaproteobacteria bacterium]
MSTAQWSNYWSEGNLTSLPQGFSGNYDDDIKQFWWHQFDRLENTARILDVCSGNGAIALLAAEYAKEKNRDFSIIATDAAKLDKAQIAKMRPEVADALALITFIDRTPLEQLALDEQSIDLVTSQYGIEYTDWERSAEQVARWLKPGGFLAIISHARDTVIIDSMKSEQKEYRIIEPSGFFTRARKVLKHNPSQRELQGLLEPVGYELQRTLITRVSPLLKPLMNTVQFVFNASPERFAEQKAEVMSYLNGLIDAMHRLRDLLSVHERFDASPNWFQTFERDGISLIHEEKLIYRGSISAGNSYIYQKSAS